MTKFMFMAASAALALASCSSEEEIAIQQTSDVNEGAVTFGAYVGRQTRATLVNDAYLQANGFGVFAFEQNGTAWNTYRASNSQPNFFYNQKVAYEGIDHYTLASPITAAQKADLSTGFQGIYNVDKGSGNWEPNVDTYSVTDYEALTDDDDKALCTPAYALGGASATWSYSPVKYFSNNENALHTFFAYAPYSANVKSVFSLSNNGPAIRYTYNEDYDLLWAEPTIDQKKQAVDEKINFVFKHALSKVAFKVGTFTNEVHTGAPSHDVTTPLDENTTITIRSIKFVGNVPSQGLLSLYDGSWKIESTEEGAYEFAKTPLLELTSANTTDYADLSSDKMVIPTRSGEGVNVQIVYDVTTVDAENPKNSSTVTNTITSKEKFDLLAGTAYLFKLDLGMTTVKFNASVTPWDTEIDKVVDLPNNHEFHRIGKYIDVAAAPSAATNFTKGTTIIDATGSDDDFFYNTTTGVMYKKASGTWTDAYAPVGAYFTAANGDLYVVETVGYACKINPEVVKKDNNYYAKGAWSTPIASPAALYSLTVNSEGKIQTGPTSWVAAPTNNNTYYTYDGILYLWKGASH